MVRFLTGLFNLCIEMEVVPEDLNEGLLVPLLKALKPMLVVSSNRPVMLLSVIRKLLTSILAERHKPPVYSHVRERQAGFRAGRSTADGVFSVRMSCERACIGDWSYAVALLDFSRAFDTIDRGKLLARLASMQAPSRLLAKLLSNTRVRVKFAGQLGEEFQSNTGVFHGDCIFPLSFVAYLETTMRLLDARWDASEREAAAQAAARPQPGSRPTGEAAEAGAVAAEQPPLRRSSRLAARAATPPQPCCSSAAASAPAPPPPGSSGAARGRGAGGPSPPPHGHAAVAKAAADVPVRDTAFADDIALHQNSADQLQAMIDLAKPLFGDDSLEMNEAKNQVVEARAARVREQGSWRNIKHLGSLLGTAEDVEHRIRRAEVAFSTIPWRRHKLSVGIQLFRALVMSVLLYNAGLWTLTETLEKRLDGWQRRKMRFVGGFLWPNKISNEALYAVFGGMKSVSYTCRKLRLGWLGHVIREGEGSASYEALRKAVNIGDIRWRRRGWKAQVRWVDVVNRDLGKIGLDIIKAKTLALDKGKWAAIVDRCSECWASERGSGSRT